MNKAIRLLLFSLLATGSVFGAALNVYDIGAAGTENNVWADSIGSRDLASSGATSVVFADDGRVSISRAFKATNANLNIASGLPLASYTLEWWLDFGGAVVPGEVVFESGGGANGFGLFSRTNGLEFATISTTGSDALAAVSLATLDLAHFVQVVATFDTATSTISLTAKDVDGTTVGGSSVSAFPLGTGTANGMSLFAGGNGNYSNIAGAIGGAFATGVSLPATPDVFSGKIGLFTVWGGVDAASTAASYDAIVLEANRANDPRPNFIIVYTDDHGYADVGAQGQDADVAPLTPSIDRIANEGVRFSAGYVTAPQCVPSRAGILSGQYQERFGVDKNGNGPLPQAVVTVAERLRRAGYRTGMTGKWHMEVTSSDTEWMTANGYADIASVPLAVKEQFFPDQQGFEEFAEGYTSSYWKNFERNGSNGTPLGVRQTETGHRVDIQSDFAVSFIERNHNRPFFFYLSYYAPHVPATWVDRYHTTNFYPNLPEKRRIALSMIKAMDDGVQRVLAKLAEHGIDGKTIIWFIGDNGAPLGFQEVGNVGATDASVAWNGSLNTPWLGEKGMLAEGGIRTPCLMRWAGTVVPQVYTKPVISLDVAATANALAGLPSDPLLDGVNLVPYLTGTDTNAPHDRLFWRFWDQCAVREGRWKYIKPSASTDGLLFDLESDANEKENLIGLYPGLAADLDAKVEAWKAGLFRPGNLGSVLNSSEVLWYRRNFGINLAYEFNVNGDAEGWTPGGITNPRVAGGSWLGETTSNATISQADFLVVGASVDRVLVKASLPVTGTLELQWAHRNDDIFTAARSVSLPVVGSAAPQWLVYPMEEQGEWNNEMVTQVRFVFTSSSGQDVAIDWIRASDGDFDHDSIDDVVEGSKDTDGDGHANFEDADADDDSLADFNEGTGDPDNDGLGNFMDTDSDNDGQGDRIETLLGTSPVSSDENMSVVIGMTNHVPEVTAVPGVPGLVYRLVRSDNLVSNVWNTLEAREPTTVGDVVFTDMTNGLAQAFYRVELLDVAALTLATDSFPAGGGPVEYNTGSAAGQAPSALSGFSGAWGDGDAVIQSAGLSFGSLKTSGGSIHVTDATTGANLNNTRQFSSLHSSGTVYLGFLMKVNRTSGAFQANLRLQSGGIDIARIGVHNGVIGLANAAGAIIGSTVPNEGATHLLVAKLGLDPYGTDSMSLFMDPVPGAGEPAIVLATLSGELAFDGFRLFNNPGSSTETILEVDEIRMGKEWSLVVPAN
ncbi:MAG: sulfatase-like hydrolase/transferase [Kiritimatiellales bacterium]|nr:sulfatase-like hydrolase/transferase [Kiritimatiellales bacterium]